MLDNILYLMRETVLSGYLILLAAQILLLVVAIRRQKAFWWIMAFMLDGISILAALSVVIRFHDTISRLADTFFSIGALWVFVLMLYTAISFKSINKRDG